MEGIGLKKFPVRVLPSALTQLEKKVKERCVHMHTCIHALYRHLCTCAYTCTFKHACVHMKICAWVRICAHMYCMHSIHKYACIHIHMHMHIYTSTCVYVQYTYMCTCTHALMHTHVCMNTRIHTRIVVQHTRICTHTGMYAYMHMCVLDAHVHRYACVCMYKCVERWCEHGEAWTQLPEGSAWPLLSLASA